MKEYKYKVIYANGNEQVFICGDFIEAVVCAMKYAIDKAWDRRIKFIQNTETLMQIEGIDIKYRFSN
jgi:chorismate-pyruvate lyase